MGNSSSRIWRTVVFAGAMLATPLAGCGSGSHRQTTPTPTPAPPPAHAAPQAAQREADAKQAQEAADLLAAQKLAEEEAARKEEEDRERLEAAQRIRGSGGGPRGRGFVLS